MNKLRKLYKLKSRVLTNMLLFEERGGGTAWMYFKDQKNRINNQIKAEVK